MVSAAQPEGCVSISSDAVSATLQVRQPVHAISRETEALCVMRVYAREGGDAREKYSSSWPEEATFLLGVAFYFSCWVGVSNRKGVRFG